MCVYIHIYMYIYIYISYGSKYVLCAPLHNSVVLSANSSLRGPGRSLRSAKSWKLMTFTKVPASRCSARRAIFGGLKIDPGFTVFSLFIGTGMVKFASSNHE